jgi:hypothetical protein
MGVYETWRYHPIARIDDGVNSRVVVFPDVLDLTAINDYASVSENAMLISLKGDDNLGVDSDALRHGVPPYTGYGSSVKDSDEESGRAGIHLLRNVLDASNIAGP